MTTVFDRVGTCPRTAVSVVEGYTPRAGIAHGSLDVVVRTCEACHRGVREQMDGCGMTPYSAALPGGGVGRECGTRVVFEENAYTVRYRE